MTNKHRLWLHFLAAISKIKFIQGLGIYTIIYRRYTYLRGIPPTLHFRQLFDAIQKHDPLVQAELPTITLGIVCHPKDFGPLNLVIEQALNHSRNPISEVVLVTTKEGYDELCSRFPNFEIRDENKVFPLI